MFDFKFDWKPDMCIGIEELDLQHQQLFQIARNVEQLVQNNCIGVSDRQILDIVCNLREFSSYHFYKEEEMMGEMQYENYSAHKAEHEEMTKKIMGVDLNAFRSEPLKWMKWARDEIQSYIFSHMLGEDANFGRAYQKYLAGKETGTKTKVLDPNEEKYGPKVFDFDVSTAYLCREQSYKGRMILVYREKTRGISKMSALERNMFYTDLSKATKAVERAFSPDALECSYMGDVELEMHMHIIPKYKGGYGYGQSFVPDPGLNYPSEEELEKIILKLQKELR